MAEVKSRYWLRLSVDGAAWQEVTVKQFAEAESNAGFVNKAGGKTATGGFSGNGVVGRVTDVGFEEGWKFDEAFYAMIARPYS